MTKYHTDDYIKFLRDVSPAIASGETQKLSARMYMSRSIQNPHTLFQTTWATTARYLTVSMSSASYPQGDPLVRVLGYYDLRAH